MWHLKHYSYSYCVGHLQNLRWDRPWEERWQWQRITGTALVSAGSSPEELGLPAEPPCHAALQRPRATLPSPAAWGLSTARTRSAAPYLLLTKRCVPAVGSEPYNLETATASQGCAPLQTWVKSHLQIYVYISITRAQTIRISLALLNIILHKSPLQESISKKHIGTQCCTHFCSSKMFSLHWAFQFFKRQPPLYINTEHCRRKAISHPESPKWYFLLPQNKINH